MSIRKTTILQVVEGQVKGRGPDVPPYRLAATLDDIATMPDSIEKGLKHVGAEHLFFAEHFLDSAKVEELVEPWYHMEEHRVAVDCRPAIESFADFIDSLDDPEKLTELPRGHICQR